MPTSYVVKALICHVYVVRKINSPSLLWTTRPFMVDPACCPSPMSSTHPVLRLYWITGFSQYDIFYLICMGRFSLLEGIHFPHSLPGRFSVLPGSSLISPLGKLCGETSTYWGFCSPLVHLLSVWTVPSSPACLTHGGHSVQVHAR